MSNFEHIAWRSLTLFLAWLAITGTVAAGIVGAHLLAIQSPIAIISGIAALASGFWLFLWSIVLVWLLFSNSTWQAERNKYAPADLKRLQLEGA